jgi:Rab proteins geranylgeranyltransferase component A
LSADFEGKKAFPTNFSKVHHQAYSTIEYEIYAILKQTSNSEENEELLHKDEQDMSIHHVSTSLSNFQRETLEILLKDSRRYNLDLAPKIMPCRGELIELLISSGVGRYLEFKALDRTYIYSDQDNFDKVYFYYQ